MTAEPTPPEDPDPLVQCNVRIPKSLKDAIDARRALFLVDGKQLSRDAWVTRVFRNAVNRPLNPPTPTAPGMRTAPPPRHRPAN